MKDFFYRIFLLVLLGVAINLIPSDTFWQTLVGYVAGGLLLGALRGEGQDR